MHRIDGAGATVDKKFTQGNPVTGVPATTVTDAWLNDVQEELASVPAAAGIALAKGALQLLPSLGKLSGRVVDSIADLKALDKTKFARANTWGYYAPGDGGAGEYWYDSTDTTSTDNGGTIIVGADGGRWKLAPAGPVSVLQFGAKGDGINADSVNFAAAAAALSGRKIVVPTPAVSYKFAATVTVPANTEFVGECGRTTKIVKAFSGDLFRLLDGAGLESLYLDGAGATYTGRGVVIDLTNGRQRIHDCKIWDTDGACIDFASKDAGSQFSGFKLDLQRYNSGTGTGRYAVTISPVQQLSAVPRKFTHIETNGGCSFDFGGCNDTLVSDSFLADLAFTADSRGVNIVGSRVANQTALTINGHNNSIVGCDVGPQITIAAGADAITIGPGSYNSLPVIDNSGNGRNLVHHWSVAYTPTLTSGGVAPVLGNGTLSARAARNGNVVTVSWALIVGSTTTLGSGDLRISLPTWAPNFSAGIQVCGVANFNPTGVGAGFYAGFHLIPGNTQYASLRRDTSNSVTAGSPGTFATGDTLQGSFSYLVD